MIYDLQNLFQLHKQWRKMSIVIKKGKTHEKGTVKIKKRGARSGKGLNGTIVNQIKLNQLQ